LNSIIECTGYFFLIDTITIWKTDGIHFTIAGTCDRLLLVRVVGFVREKFVVRARFRGRVRAFLAFFHTLGKRASNHCFPLTFLIFEKAKQDFHVHFKNTCVKAEQKAK